MLGISVTGDDLVASALRVQAAAVGPRVTRTTRHHRQLLATAIQARMTKRTGAMAGSYHVDEEGVSSDHPGARRHEMGFHGIDARGARRNDPPHPVVGPEADRIESVFVNALERIVD